ncbi:MAG: hypothetical protein ACM3VX_00530, partial [Bacteroidota bacterium]
MPFNPLPCNPAHTSTCNQLHLGYDYVGELIARAARRQPRPLVVAIDGMWGVSWDRIITEVLSVLDYRRIPYTLVRTVDALHTPAELRRHFQPWLTDNPVFGRVCEQPLSA